MFGCVVSDTVKNLGVDGTVTGRYYVGGVAGRDWGTTKNCCYLSGKATGGINGSDLTGKAEGKTETQFNSGEVAWLLQNGQTNKNTLVWGQQLKNAPKDKCLVLTADNAKKVYQVEFAVNGKTDRTAYTNSGGIVAVSDPDTANVPSGKVFEHWEYNGSEFTGSTQVTGDITVTAVLTSNKPDLSNVTVTIEKGKDYINVTLDTEIANTEFYYTDESGEHTSANGKFTGLTPRQDV